MRGGIRYMAGVEIGLKTHYMWITSGSVCSRADSGAVVTLPGRGTSTGCSLGRRTGTVASRSGRIAVLIAS